MSETLEFVVPGMTCGHCRSAVEREVSRVAGVERVDVDLDSKHVLVRGAGVSEPEVRAAIAEAGYEAS